MSPTPDRSPPLKLNDALDFTPSVTRGGLRYVVEDRSRQRFLRLGRREYLLATAFDGRRSVAQAVEAAKRAAPGLQWTERFVAEALRWLTS